MRIRAFISCRFPISPDVRAIAHMLGDEIAPFFSDQPKLGNLAYNLKQQIADADCLIAIAVDDQSPFMQNELGIAHAMGKPVIAIARKGVAIDGILQYITTWIPFEDLRECAQHIASVRGALVNELTSRFLVPGGPDALVTELGRLGVIGCYADRASAFRQFLRFWNEETDIAIVGSTLEGFRKCLGVDPRKLLSDKLCGKPPARVRLLLTHSEFIAHREQQESVSGGTIERELEQTNTMLSEVQNDCRAGERLSWRFFRGAPTCFLIVAGDYMLLNPYLYMQPAIFNFSLIVRNTAWDYDIYHRYRAYHLERAWDHPVLTTNTL